MSLIVRRFVEADSEAYRRLIAADARTMIYATLEYRDFLSACLSATPEYLVAWNDGQLVGALPTFVCDHPELGRVVNSLPWYGSHGGCIVAPGGEADIRAALLDAYVALCSDGPLLSSTLVTSLHHEEEHAQYIAKLKFAIIEQRIGQVTHLPEAGGDISAQLFAGCRYPGQIRKALQQGFDLHLSDEDWAWRFLHEVHAENMMAVGGRAKPWAHFVALRERIPAQWRSLSVAMLDGEPVAAMLVLRFNRTVEYFIPVIRRQYRSQQPLSFLIWHEMLRAIAQGDLHWNWGGTWPSQRSLYHFKSGWGARDYPYTYIIQATDAAVDLMRSKKAELANFYPFFYCYPIDLL